MKPLGAIFRGDGTIGIIHPTPIEDAIYEAVELACDDGWTPEQFRREAANCWDTYLEERKRLDRKAWAK